MFWVLTFVYYWIQSIVPEKVEDFSSIQMYKNAVISVLCFLPACIFSVYFSVYLIMQHFLVQRRYFIALLAFLGLFAADVFVNYFFGSLFIQNTVFDGTYNQSFTSKIALGYQNSIWAISISGFALGIKFTKTWYLQRKENLKIAKNNARTSVQTQKAYLHPAFLFRTLDNVDNTLKAKSGTSSDIILKLSDLLSFTLYENESDIVPLEREISAIRDFIYIEKLNPNSSAIQFKVSGAISQIYVPPMLILSLLQDSISHLYSQKYKTQIILIIIISANHLFIKLSASLLEDRTGLLKWSLIVEKGWRKLAYFFDDKDFHISLNETHQGILIKMNFPVKSAEVTTTSTNNNIITNQDIYESV